MTAQQRHTFRPHERLRTSREYQRVRREGRCVRTAHFRIHYAPNGLSHHRLGLVVQKRYWNAVKRNRIKRCLRECFRLSKHDIPPPNRDLVVIALPGAESMKTSQINRELLTAMSKAGSSGSCPKKPSCC